MFVRTGLTDGTTASLVHAVRGCWVFWKARGDWGGATMKIQEKDYSADTYHDAERATADAPLTNTALSVTDDVSTRFWAAAGQTFRIVISGGTGEDLDVSFDGSGLREATAND